MCVLVTPVADCPLKLTKERSDMPFYVGYAVRDPEQKPEIKPLGSGIYEAIYPTEYQIHIFKTYEASKVLLLNVIDQEIHKLIDAGRLSFAEVRQAADAANTLEESSKKWLSDDGVRSIHIGAELALTIGDFDKGLPKNHKIIADHRNCTFMNCQGMEAAKNA